MKLGFCGLSLRSEVGIGMFIIAIAGLVSMAFRNGLLRHSLNFLAGVNNLVLEYTFVLGEWGKLLLCGGAGLGLGSCFDHVDDVG